MELRFLISDARLAIAPHREKRGGKIIDLIDV